MEEQWLADRYYLLGRLGSGVFGTVYLAQDRLTDSYVAVKTPVERQEYRLLASISHSQVPACYDYCQIGTPLLW